MRRYHTIATIHSLIYMCVITTSIHNAIPWKFVIFAGCYGELSCYYRANGDVGRYHTIAAIDSLI